MCHNDANGTFVEDGILAKDLRVGDTYGTYFTFGSGDECPNGTFKTVTIVSLEVAFLNAQRLRPTGEENSLQVDTLHHHRHATPLSMRFLIFDTLSHHHRHTFPSTCFLSPSTRFLTINTLSHYRHAFS
jgi:hypothetical protein